MWLHQIKCCLHVLHANHLSELRPQQQISSSICCVARLMMVEPFTLPCRQRFLTASWLLGNKICFFFFFQKNSLNAAPLKVCQRQSIFREIKKKKTTNETENTSHCTKQNVLFKTLQKWCGWMAEHRSTRILDDDDDDDAAPEMETFDEEEERTTAE